MTRKKGTLMLEFMVLNPPPRKGPPIMKYGKRRRNSSYPGEPRGLYATNPGKRSSKKKPKNGRKTGGRKPSKPRAKGLSRSEVRSVVSQAVKETASTVAKTLKPKKRKQSVYSAKPKAAKKRKPAARAAKPKAAKKRKPDARATRWAPKRDTYRPSIKVKKSKSGAYRGKVSNTVRSRLRSLNIRRNPDLKSALMNVFKPENLRGGVEAVAGFSAALVLPMQIAKATRMPALNQGAGGVLMSLLSTGLAVGATGFLPGSLKSDKTASNVMLGGLASVIIKGLAWVAPQFAAALIPISRVAPVVVEVPAQGPAGGATGKAGMGDWLELSAKPAGGMGAIVSAEDMIAGESRALGLRGENMGELVPVNAIDGMGDWVEVTPDKMPADFQNWKPGVEQF